MNEDHAESVLAYAHWYAKMPEAEKATMLNCPEEGFLLQVEWQGGGGDWRPFACFRGSLRSPPPPA